MKTIIIIIIFFLIAIGCKSKKNSNQQIEGTTTIDTVAVIAPTLSESLSSDSTLMIQDTVGVKQVTLPGYIIAEAKMNKHALKITLSQLRNAPEVTHRPVDAANISYVVLETNDSCYIDFIEKIIPTREYYFIQRKNEQIFQFRKDGSFVRTIGLNGRGPEEYVKINDFYADEVGQKVYITDRVGDIVEYDFQGKFLRKTHWKRKNAYIHVWKNKYFILLPENYGGKTADKLLVTTLKQDTILKSPNHFFYNIGDLEFSIIQSPVITELNDEIVFFQTFEDTVYTYHPASQVLEVRYYFDFGTEKMTPEKMAPLRNDRRTKITKNAIFIGGIFEDKQAVYVKIYEHGGMKCYILDKNSGQIEYLPYGLLQYGYERVGFTPVARDGDVLIGIVPGVSSLIRNIDKMNDKSKLKPILKTLSEDSNPLLMLVEPVYSAPNEK